MRLPYKSLIFAVDKIAFGTNKHLLILKVKVSGDAKLFFYMIRLVDIGMKLVYAGILTF